MILKQLTFLIFMTLLLVSSGWSEERAIRPMQTDQNTTNRHALVIGNAAYNYAGILRNPVNDARAISKTLKQLGFDVTTATDVDQRQMEKAIQQFGATLRERNGVGLFYYAGHGMQFDGENYLFPIDINPSNEVDVRYDAVPLGKLLGQMQTAGNRMNMVVLDACRNNPFARSFRTFNPGLAQIVAPEGTFISFATAPGRVAADGQGDHGLFTSKLLKHLKTPGIKLEEVFKRVGADVYRESDKQQVPWVQYAVIGDFYFVPGEEPSQNQDSVAVLEEKLPPKTLTKKNLNQFLSGTNQSTNDFAEKPSYGTLYGTSTLPMITGEWRNSKNSDFDSIYNGMILNGKPQGKGTITFSQDGMKFKVEGQFNKGLLYGFGTGSMSGPKFGKIHSATFSGIFKNGLLNGDCTYDFIVDSRKTQQFTLTGQCVDYIPTGVIQLKIRKGANKSTWEGPVKNFAPDGEGIMTDSNGNRRKIVFRNGKPVN